MTTHIPYFMFFQYYLYPTIPLVTLQPALEDVQDANTALKARTTIVIANNFFILHTLFVIKYKYKLALAGVGNKRLFFKWGIGDTIRNDKSKKQIVYHLTK